LKDISSASIYIISKEKLKTSTVVENLIFCFQVPASAPLFKPQSTAVALDLLGLIFYYEAFEKTCAIVPRDAAYGNNTQAF
jgi:hypothetical protein